LLAIHEVPSRIVLLTDLPRGAKVKMKLLVIAERLLGMLQATEEPARGELEELVAQTFASVLQQSVPGRNANFFLLGGDSLSSTRVISRLQQQLLLELPTTLLFDYPMISNLAEQLDKLLDQALAAAEDVTS
jgi:acyl carrier protein